MPYVDAINNLRILSFTYHGHPRIVVPSAYGRHATTGNLMLRGYQIDGSSSSRPVPFWTLYKVDEIVGAAPTGETFDGPPAGYQRDDAHINPIIAQL